MNSTKTWEILNKTQLARPEDVIATLLTNRGFQTKKDQDAFLHPDIGIVTPKSVGIDTKSLPHALKRIQIAKEQQEQIIVFGDYDVDGIAGTAILWETLNHFGAKATPYIPSRIEEGYGLSIAGIDNVLIQNPQTRIIITVDNGIVANEAVAYAKTKGIDVILTDHHTLGEKKPDAYTIIHTTRLCGTGVAWVFAREIEAYAASAKLVPLGDENDHLALVALATVADLVPLTDANRILLTEGLNILHTTKRPGIVALCEEAGIKQKEIGVYEIGHMIGPRLNAMGRIASAMDSLRLLCTKDRMRAKVLAEKLGITNKERQIVTQNSTYHAIEKVRKGETKLKDLLVVADTSYEEGVIGLVAGKLVEEFYRPAIVLSVGAKKSKASARSIKGFNIIEFIRTASHLLINAGGHPMAAGFTIETGKIGELERFFATTLSFSKDLLIRSLRIDCEIAFDSISQKLYEEIQKLGPFGMGNPEPLFVSEVKIINVKQIGKDKKHLSLQVSSSSDSPVGEESRSKGNSSRLRSNSNVVQAISFGMGDMMSQLKPGQEVEIVYVIDENVWNGKKNLQLKIKDIKIQK